MSINHRGRENSLTQQSHVHCTVDNCKWWGEEDVCVADKLLVVSDDFAEDLPNEQDVEETEEIVNQMGRSPITDCTQSCCKTFVPRDQYDAGLAGTNPQAQQ